MKRRNLLTMVSTGVLVGVTGCIDTLEGVEGAEREDGYEAVTGDEADPDDENDADNEGIDDKEDSGKNDAGEKDTPGEYTIVEYEPFKGPVPEDHDTELGYAPPPALITGHFSDKSSWLITSEEGGEAVLEGLENTRYTEWYVDSARDFIDETVFSESVLIYANRWAGDTCTVLETVDVGMDDDSVHLDVTSQRSPSKLPCGEAMTPIAQLVRVTFEGETPDTGTITYVDSDHTEEATDVEEVEDW